MVAYENTLDSFVSQENVFRNTSNHQRRGAGSIPCLSHFYRKINMQCPICNNETLVEGETCDVGFGESNGVKIGPDYCEFCEYVEAGLNLTPSFDHYQKCWELQIDPNPPVS